MQKIRKTQKFESKGGQGASQPYASESLGLSQWG